MIRPGDRVRMHYTITLEDGRIADSTRDADCDALEFTMGGGDMHPCLERLVEQLEDGDIRSFTLPPEQAFGMPDPRAIQAMGLDEFPRGMHLQPGLLVGFDLPTGEQVPGLILSIEGRRVNVDFNHPLAGHTITVDLEILGVNHCCC